MHEDCWRQVVIPAALGNYEAMDSVGNCITGLSRINAFIGPNNSGKSRLLRALFNEECKFTSGFNSQDAVIEAIAALRELKELEHLSARATFFRDLVQLLQSITPLRRDFRSADAQAKDWQSMQHFRQIPEHLRADIPDHVRDSIEQCSTTINTHLPQKLNGLQPMQSTRVYVPALRGLRPPDKDVDYWLTRTNSDYFKKGNIGGLNKGGQEEPEGRVDYAYIFTGFELYDLVKCRLLGSLSQRHSIRKFEEFLSSLFFDNTPVALIPRHDPPVLFVKIGEAEEREIHNLGDGIQHIIIMTLPLFLFRNHNLQLFIEEPELFIHPGYQRLLINAFLADPNPRLQVFVATHAHQFMDITIDTSRCSVYKVTRRLEGAAVQSVIPEKFYVARSSTSDFDTLRALGVRNSSVLLSNCTIWVEGITDRLYLRHYLQLMQEGEEKQLREDIEFSIVEYGGGNITHWSFLADDGIDVSRLCSPVYVLIDADAPKRGSKKGQRTEILVKRLGASATSTLPVREMENLLKPHVIKGVLAEFGDNVSNDFEQNAYRSKLLGTYIDKTLLGGSPNREGGYAAKSGTIKSKPDFCTRALRYIESVADMSDDAKALARHVLAFVQSHNQ